MEFEEFLEVNKNKKNSRVQGLGFVGAIMSLVLTNCTDENYAVIGDPTKAKTKLGWVSEYDLESLVKDMMQSDVTLMQKVQYLKKGGYSANNYYE